MIVALPGLFSYLFWCVGTKSFLEKYISFIGNAGANPFLVKYTSFSVEKQTNVDRVDFL